MASTADGQAAGNGGNGNKLLAALIGRMAKQPLQWLLILLVLAMLGLDVGDVIGIGGGGANAGAKVAERVVALEKTVAVQEAGLLRMEAVLDEIKGELRRVNDKLDDLRREK